MQLTSFAEANRYLARFYKNIRKDYSLDNMRRLMGYLGNPQEKFKAVHVAGTSGKTSTTYYMSALLTASGHKTGLTVSPHVDEINERLQINGQPLPEKEFCSALTEFLEIIEGSGVEPSWFEVMIAFAYWYFAKVQVEYAVIEVGLGGLKDGTNVINRADKVCIITDIGLDHTDVLGKNLTEIATQKAGIIQKGNAVFMYEQSSIMKVIEGQCVKQQAELFIVGEVNVDVRRRNWRLAYEAYQYLQTRDDLKILGQNDLDKTQQAQIPGRMEVLKIKDKTVIMDGAHNAQKMQGFINNFRRLYPDVKPGVLISMKQGKEYKEVAPLLAEITGKVIVTTYQANQDTPINSMDPQILAEAFRAENVPTEVIEDPKQAFKALLASKQPVCLVTGSFYLLGQIRNNKS